MPETNGKSPHPNGKSPAEMTPEEFMRGHMGGPRGGAGRPPILSAWLATLPMNKPTEFPQHLSKSATQRGRRNSLSTAVVLGGFSVRVREFGDEIWVMRFPSKEKGDA